jgi:hypothetical protein
MIKLFLIILPAELNLDDVFEFMHLLSEEFVVRLIPSKRGGPIGDGFVFFFIRFIENLFRGPLAVVMIVAHHLFLDVLGAFDAILQPGSRPPAFDAGDDFHVLFFMPSHNQTQSEMLND